MTSAKRLFHSPAGGLSAGVLFILTACAQPVQSDEEAGVETAPASEMAEPQQAETSEPADPNSKASAEPDPRDDAASIMGDWSLISERRGMADIELSGQPRMASGDVSIAGDWPFATQTPVRWLYLAPDTLTLVDEGANIVWQGRRAGEGFSGHMEGGAPRAALVRE